MYAHISQLFWDYEKEGRVEGRVHLPGSDVQRFSLDPNEMTDFDITNELWQIIGSKLE